MNQSLKYIIVLLGIVLAALALVYGSYLPLMKSQAYVTATMKLSSLHTVADLQDAFNVAFNVPGPIGGEEVSKFLESNILTILENQQSVSEPVARALVDYIVPHVYNNPRQLITMAATYEWMWKQYGHPEDFAAAEDYYKRAIAIGPKLPPALYGLLQLYLEGGKLDKAQELAKTIIQYWPTDTRLLPIVAGTLQLKPAK